MARSPDFEGEQSKVTSILRAIGNTKRLRILNELSDGQERSVSELEILSQHLANRLYHNIWVDCDAPTSCEHAASRKRFTIRLMIMMCFAFYAYYRIFTKMTR
jgi:hypothetical protein